MVVIAHMNKSSGIPVTGHTEITDCWLIAGAPKIISTDDIRNRDTRKFKRTVSDGFV